jgi:hypothetical protein
MLLHRPLPARHRREAVSGVLMGMRRSMERLGLRPVGTVATLGGGTVRDVLPGHSPLAWISHTDYVLITIEAAKVVTGVRHRARTGVDRDAGRRLRDTHAGRARPLASQSVERRRSGRRKLIAFSSSLPATNDPAEKIAVA